MLVTVTDGYLNPVYPAEGNLVLILYNWAAQTVLFFQPNPNTSLLTAGRR